MDINVLSKEICYSLYKAKFGDVIDGRYKKMSGGIEPDDQLDFLTPEGYLRLSQRYVVYFKDLTDDKMYYTGESLSSAPPSASVTGHCFYEPFGEKGAAIYPAIPALHLTKTVEYYEPGGYN